MVIPVRALRLSPGRRVWPSPQICSTLRFSTEALCCGKTTPDASTSHPPEVSSRIEPADGLDWTENEGRSGARPCPSVLITDPVLRDASRLLAVITASAFLLAHAASRNEEGWVLNALTLAYIVFTTASLLRFEGLSAAGKTVAVAVGLAMASLFPFAITARARHALAAGPDPRSVVSLPDRHLDCPGWQRRRGHVRANRALAHTRRAAAGQAASHAVGAPRRETVRLPRLVRGTVVLARHQGLNDGFLTGPVPNGRSLALRAGRSQRDGLSVDLALT